ncbi:Zinc finger BED domain-containing protein 4 [Frankliniella fusca]|uniref:Zinc finger BED domain-containing protein 4 n=1 Tax=Frankliniella fusca TaxID=407009 RepID=A0AAE1LKB1_9NEOP|nr:Zinc finger BED domain-containing protein 4 [Frankliniella fusca]
MVKQVGVDTEMVKVYIVTDNASNIVAALEQPPLSRLFARDVPTILRGEKPWIHLRCFDHTLQLAIGDAREEVGTHTVIEKVANIVKRYSYSNIARQNLEKHQKETNTVQHEIIRHVCTRWNSEYAMLERFLEQRIPITLELTEAGKDVLSAQQWKLCEGYVEILKPIAQFTAEMGSSTKPTFSMMIPVLSEIKNCLEEFLRKASNRGSGISFARALLNKIILRFPDSDYADSKMHQTATILDPRFKALLFSEDVDAHGLLLVEAKRKYREYIRRGKLSLPAPAGANASQDDTAPKPAKQSKWSFLKKVSAKQSEGPDEIESILQKEVQTYLELGTIDVEHDPALWWKTNRDTFPHLTPLAAEYLGIGATEVQSERDFSIGSNAVTPKRSCLLQDHVRQTVFLHRNLMIPDIKYKK